MLPLLDEEEKGLKTYFEQGLIYKEMNMIGSAMSAFLSCIESEEVESHKAYYELSKIYMKLNDFAGAYNYCIDALKLKSDYIESLYYIVHILYSLKTPIDELKRIVEGFLKNVSLDHTIIAHIFYMERYYETTLEYIMKFEIDDGLNDNTKLLKVKCLIRTSRYDECIHYIDTISEADLYFFKFMMYKIICLAIDGEYEFICEILNKFNYLRLSRYNRKTLLVYTQFYNLISNNTTEVMSEDEMDIDYTTSIFEIYDILLINEEFVFFEQALVLLNLISDKTVLLQLGKLYAKYGYVDLAKKEIIRSIKQFEIFDTDGLNILNL